MPLSDLLVSKHKWRRRSRHCPGQLAVQMGTCQAGPHRLKEIRQVGSMLCPMLSRL